MLGSTSQKRSGLWPGSRFGTLSVNQPVTVTQSGLSIPCATVCYIHRTTRIRHRNKARQTAVNFHDKPALERRGTPFFSSNCLFLKWKSRSLTSQSNDLTPVSMASTFFGKIHLELVWYVVYNMFSAVKRLRDDGNVTTTRYGARGKSSKQALSFDLTWGAV